MRQRLPITPGVLIRMKTTLEGRKFHYDNQLLWAMCTTAFFTFCRSGELTVPSEQSFDPSVHLCLRDMAVNDAANPTVVRLHLKCSKTDQECKGADLIMGITGDSLCPVEALLGYIKLRGSSPGPLFQRQSGGPVTKSYFVLQVKELLAEAGLPAEKFAGHSFRIGAASTASAVGLEDSMIKRLGRWKSGAYLSYVKVAPNQVAATSRALVGVRFRVTHKLC